MKLYSILTPLGVAAAVTVQAQSTQPWTFRAGYSALADRSAQSTLKVDGFSAGFGYDLSRFRTGLSFDVNFDSHIRSDARIQSTSGMFVYRMPVSEANNYFGIGVGAVNNNVKYTIGVGSSTTTVSQTKTVLGGEIIFGVKVDESSSLELVGRLSAKTLGLNPSTIGLVYCKHF